MSSLRYEDYRLHADLVIMAVLKAAEPRRLMKEAMERVPVPPGPVHLVAFGKAAVPMTMAASVALGERLRFGICTHVPGTNPRPAAFPAVVGSMPADHPLPTHANLEAAEAIRFTVSDFAGSCGEGNMSTLVVLISGGGSAHLTLPAGNLGLEDLRRVANGLLRTGATINELNCVRKHLELLKGGRLAALACPGRVLVYVLSDVVGDHVDVIASGPCAADPTTYAQAAEVMKKFGLDKTSEHALAMDHLVAGKNGLHEETPKPGESVFDRVQHVVIGNHVTAVEAAVSALRALGFLIVAPSLGVQGEAREVAVKLIEEAAALSNKGRQPVAVVYGGETTVNVRGTGTGGRNQELALAAAIRLAGHSNAAAFTFATDGADASTGNAGAVVSDQTCRIAGMMSLEPQAMLDNNDSATFFARLDLGGAGAAIRTDPTGTNVNDIAVALFY